MPEAVRFHFDPICPWCYQTSRWARRLAELGEVDLTWGLFSLEVVNADRPELAGKAHNRSALALRTMVLVREAGGGDAVGRMYAALGERVHERNEALEAPETVGAALSDAGLDDGLAEKAASDESTWEAVLDEHRALVERTRSFGVPTIVLDGGDGPAIFGPVISRLPDDADAIELFRHVAWLTRYANFSELKRDRVEPPDLEAVRQRREQS